MKGPGSSEQADPKRGTHALEDDPAIKIERDGFRRQCRRQEPLRQEEPCHQPNE